MPASSSAQSLDSPKKARAMRATAAIFVTLTLLFLGQEAKARVCTQIAY
jgi:hypothetical protein